MQKKEVTFRTKGTDCYSERRPPVFTHHAFLPFNHEIVLVFCFERNEIEEIANFEAESRYFLMSIQALA